MALQNRDCKLQEHWETLQKWSLFEYRESYESMITEDQFLYMIQSPKLKQEKPNFALKKN
jgi:hypothetical protein